MEAACSTNPVCEDIGCESNPPSLNCKESNTEDQQYGRSNMNDTPEIEIQEDCNYSSEIKKECFIDEAFGVPSYGVHLQDSHAQFSEIASISHENDMASSVEITTYMESKCLSKSATFPSSEMEFSSHSFSVEEIEASSTYKRSVSLPIFQCLFGGGTVHLVMEHDADEDNGHDDDVEDLLIMAWMVDGDSQPNSYHEALGTTTFGDLSSSSTSTHACPYLALHHAMNIAHSSGSISFQDEPIDLSFWFYKLGGL